MCDYSSTTSSGQHVREQLDGTGPAVAQRLASSEARFWARVVNDPQTEADAIRRRVTCSQGANKFCAVAPHL